MEISATLSSPVPAEELGSGGSRPNTTVGQHSAMAPKPSGRHLPQRARGKQSSGMAHRESNLQQQQHPSNPNNLTHLKDKSKTTKGLFVYYVLTKKGEVGGLTKYDNG